MQFSFGKLFIALGSGLLCAILGASLMGWRASAAVASAGARADENDPLAQVNPAVIGPAAAAVFKGALWGGLIGVVLAIVVLYLIETERIRIERKFDRDELGE